MCKSAIFVPLTSSPPAESGMLNAAASQRYAAAISTDAGSRPRGMTTEGLRSLGVLRHAQLLLQLGRAGRVLEHHALARRDDALGGLGHQRRFVEAREDQLELAGIVS